MADGQNNFQQLQAKMAGLSSEYKKSDPQAYQELRARLDNAVGNTPAPSMQPSTPNVFTQSQPSSQDLANKFSDPSNQNYQQKAAALQNIIDNAGSQGAIQDAQNQLTQLKANQPSDNTISELDEDDNTNPQPKQTFQAGY